MKYAVALSPIKSKLINEFDLNVDGNKTDKEMKKIADYVFKVQITGMRKKGR
ncbi:hypothetical protein J22TS1_21570 [Siminovitchia terrae]|nr:hypothetical protein J22TS1_21570 [Siminovitchia terrae]